MHFAIIFACKKYIFMDKKQVFWEKIKLLELKNVGIDIQQRNHVYFFGPKTLLANTILISTDWAIDNSG